MVLSFVVTLLGVYGMNHFHILWCLGFWLPCLGYVKCAPLARARENLKKHSKNRGKYIKKKKKPVILYLGHIKPHTFKCDF